MRVIVALGLVIASARVAHADCVDEATVRPVAFEIPRGLTFGGVLRIGYAEDRVRARYGVGRTKRCSPPPRPQ